MEEWTFLIYALVAILLMALWLFDHKRPYLWLLPGAILALILAGISADLVPWWAELIVFVLFGLLGIFVGRPLYIKALAKKEEIRNGEEEEDRKSGD